jgi:hypothetical protein
MYSTEMLEIGAYHAGRICNVKYLNCLKTGGNLHSIKKIDFGW